MSKSSDDEDTAGFAPLTTVETSHKELGTANASVRRDGRVNITLSDRALKAATILENPTRRRGRFAEALTDRNREYNPHFQPFLSKSATSPRLNIAVHIVGSRGDVQPFIAIGQVLSKPPYNHRVRIATHPVFKSFVEENGLEFFSIGGDPANLMAYMVKNPGLMPGIDSLRAGDVSKRRADIAEIIHGCWRSCVESGDGLGGYSNPAGAPEVTDPTDRLFIADAIIANPPSYAHIHCAEKLGIPLHMIFTMPWSPTQVFPHPLASFERAQPDPNVANYISYTMMELLAWQGLGDVINAFRVRTLNLDAISPLWGHALLPRMKVPYTYLWSQALIPKPEDWGSHINISGFSFLKQAANYKPPEDLMEFLNAGPPPVYIGFGSIVVDDPEKLTSMIYGAVKRAGVRALVSKGWGGIGGDAPPPGVFLLGNVPHDWLFQYVSCVVHHGGAGTTAIGIAMGKPTVVVPFFGDQPFWGSMIYKAGAGPEPVPFKKMTEDSLYNSIREALGPEILENVKKMSEKIAGENGAQDAAASFQAAINIDSMRCFLDPDRLAVWRIRGTDIRLSSLAAAVLVDDGLVDVDGFKLVKHRDWFVDEGPMGPGTGVVAAFSTTITEAIVTMSQYIRNISAISHKPEKQQEEKVETQDPLACLERDAYLERIDDDSQPITRSLQYSPQHLAYFAYQLASKSYTPTSAARKRKMDRINNWGPLRAHENKKMLKRHRQLTGEQENHGRAHEVALETGRFVDAMLDIGLKAPVAFFYNIANGFHNIPSFLFNDDTVRRRDNITGFGSGVKVAGKEFTLSLYEAFTGPFILPYKGAVASGPSGFGKGVIAGVGGVLFKTGAATFALPGYTLKGLERQIEKRRDYLLKSKILRVRMESGRKEYLNTPEEDTMVIRQRWKEHQVTPTK